MKIIRDSQSATLTFVPTEAAEEQTIASITAILRPEDRLSYGGRRQDGDDNKFCAISLHAGGRAEKKTETSQNGSSVVNYTVYVDSVELILRGTTEEDKNEVGRIRNTCYFGSGELIYIGETEVDGKKTIVVTAKRCKHCGAGMIKSHECEWETCDACAAKCDHNYIRGVISGGGTDIGVGEFCDKCGRCKPKTKGEREKSVIEHHLAAEKEGVKIIYKNGLTPRQAVEANRLARRYNKSRNRTK